MSLSTKYAPSEVEDKWYQYWLDKKFFSSRPNPDKEPYAIVIPPPNVTGVLHMGHMLNNTIQDVLIRKARMEGKEACWVPGTDHASIATESKVIAMLKEKGIEKSSLTREQFLEHAWEWKEKYGGIILNQLQKLGASCDWDRTRFTMEEELSKAVIKTFVGLYNRGYIYRGARMVNWDPQGKTALSDEEVNYKEEQSKLYYVKYAIKGEEDGLTIATTRPETILGDTAICVNPNDERYQHLKGKFAIVPFVGREIPIIFDEYVDPEFGTGCLKVTPAHDVNDYELGLKHKLETIDILNDDGTLSDTAQKYIGEDRFIARKMIAKDLEASGQLIKVEEITNKVGHSERTNAVIEPRMSTQWFMKMEGLAKPALDNVMNDQIKFHPPKFKNVYRSWMENIKDWCISRQLWWGHRIPAYYLPNGEFVVANDIDEAVKQANEQFPDQQVKAEDLKQEQDVLDTWCSSWLWPISVFDGVTQPNNEDIKYYYPTNDLVTGHDIIFFWVARMIIAGYELRGELPFKNVYFTGMVRDSQRRKMSKQLGNSPDALALIDQYGADGVRAGLLLSSPAGNDLLYDEKYIEQGRNFANKIWNAFRLVKGWEVSDTISSDNDMAIKWFDARFNEALIEIEDHFSKFRISDALMAVYKLIWDDFCSWYLEMVKPAYQAPIDRKTLDTTIGFFEHILKVLHPYMPFITEELWQNIKERDDRDCVVVASWPQTKELDKSLLDQAKHAFEVVSQVRNVRGSKQIPPKQSLGLKVITEAQEEVYQKFNAIIKKLANIEEIEMTNEVIDGAINFVVQSDKLFIPMEGAIDVEKEKEKLTKELNYMEGFLASVTKKLSNERFVQNAPEQVVAVEKKKQSDAEAKIKALKESLGGLGVN